MGCALFVGAGFSKWAANLPPASELFDFDVQPFGVREERRMNVVKAVKDNWDKEHPDGLAEQFIECALNLPPRDREAVIWYLGRRLSEPFIWQEFHAGRWRRHALMIDESRKFSRPGVVQARTFLHCFWSPNLVGIITTNYDMLVEYALGTREFNYGTPGELLKGRGAYPVAEWLRPVRLTGLIPIAKLHGSISWDRHRRYTDGRRAITGDALIVPPTRNKTSPRILESVWELAERILNRSTRLVVFGFAFNPYDEAVLSLLRSAGQNLRSVLLIDIAPKVDRARGLWPQASIIPCAPPPDGNSTLREWLATTEATERPSEKQMQTTAAQSMIAARLKT